MKSLRRLLRGIAATETLISVPILLCLGLGALQWVIVFHARSAVQRAAFEGARLGSMNNAQAEAVDRGVARGLAPWLFGASDPQGQATSLERASAHVSFGKSAGWIRWRQISPTRASFEDWAVDARDDAGRPLSGVREIPNDNLQTLALTISPASGVAGFRGSEPIGNSSGQTLLDANLLKIELTYGVPVTVPLVGRIGIWVMKAYDGCLSSREFHLGVLNLGQAVPNTEPRDWTCSYYDAADESGGRTPRWPVRVAATIRMQSPAREGVGNPYASSGISLPDVFGGAVGSLGAGRVDLASEFEPIPTSALNPGGSASWEDGSAERGAGFLMIGAERWLPAMGKCSGA